MLFRTQHSLTSLVAWCRSLRVMLDAGLSLQQTFAQQGSKGPVELRPVASRVAERLAQGESLEDALEPEREGFPELFLDLVAIGEQTGHLAEIFQELEHYYEYQVRIRKQFFAEIAWPVFQLVAAIFVIALLIFILGYIAQVNNTEPMDATGLGLAGAEGAITFLLGVGFIFAAVFLLYRFLSRKVRYWAEVEAFLLKLPAIGPCLDALAMQRFCVALQMTMEVGVSTPAAARRSLHATGNAAFTRNTSKAVAALRKGNDLHTALKRCGVFTEEFLQTLEVAEETGQVPEVMARKAGHYREEASRRLSALSRVASFGVWLIVAILIIIQIFRLWSVYFGALGQFAG